MTPQGAQQFYNWYGYWPPGYGPDAIPPFAPVFEGPFYVTSENGARALINYTNFPNEATAVEVMRRFGADHVTELPFEGAQGPNSAPATAKVRWLVWADGIAVKAGLLADQFTRNPENFYPRVAENACWRDIQDARKNGQRLPASAGRRVDLGEPEFVVKKKR